MKNTSTKIVMRLQEAADQNAVGAALGLTESQTAELYRLDKGVAIVHQEGWNEPVLTKIKNYQSPYSTKGIETLEADVSYNDIRLVRTFLLREVLCQHDSRIYSLSGLDQAIRSIGGFSKWKLADYSELFHQYDDLYSNIKKEFHRNRIRYPFFGKLITELLDCEDLFDILPVPLPQKGMHVPYSSDPEFVNLCNQWEKSVITAMEHYCDGLSSTEKRVVIKLLLLGRGEADATRIRVQAALNHKTE